MKKILYFDTETTGKDPKENGLIQLSGIIEIDGEIKEEFNFKMAPFSQDIVDPEALAVNGTTREEVQKYPDPKEVYKQITTLFAKYVDKFDREDKFYPAGYNVRFDLEFLQNFFLKNGDKFFGSWCNWRSIDALYLMHFIHYMGHLTLENYKLSTVCANYGIPIKAHDALSDIKATHTLINHIRKSMMNVEIPLLFIEAEEEDPNGPLPF